MKKTSAESSRRGKLVRRSESDIRAYAESPEAAAIAERLRANGPNPSTVDLKDIAEFDGLDPSMFRPLKQKITTRLDADVLHWLKRKEKYQTYMNDVLRAVMLNEIRTYGAEGRGQPVERKARSRAAATKARQSQPTR
jgi:uncharacterized protein (DUF4415 family)